MDTKSLILLNTLTVTMTNHPSNQTAKSSQSSILFTDLKMGSISEGPSAALTKKSKKNKTLRTQNSHHPKAPILTTL
jgi:hypothetical protein